MSIKVSKAIIFIFILLNICATQCLAANTPKITFSLKALFKDRAMLEINGEQHLLSAGEESPEGVKLISADAHEANLICHGQEFSLYINQTAYVGVAEKSELSAFNIPRKVVPGNTVAFNKENVNGVIKYTLKGVYNYPAVMEDGQDAIWIGVEKKLLRFDVEKEAWGVFDLSDNVLSRIDKISVSDKSVILKSSKLIKNKRHYGLSLFDMRTRDFYTQLDGIPSSYQFIDETLWFLDSYKGLGYVVPGKNNSKTSYRDALLYKEKPKDKNKPETSAKKSKVKNERANMLSANGNDIWYSHHSKFKRDDRRHRLDEVCVSRYNKKHKTFVRFTRKDMGLDEKINCLHLAVGDDQVWVSHENKNAGLSVFNMSTKTWKHISASANNMLVGGGKIVLDNGQLLMISNNQLIALNTKTFYARVLLGDAVIKNQWQSIFHANDGYAWYAVLDATGKKTRNLNFVLYKVSIDSTENITELSKLN